MLFFQGGEWLAFEPLVENLSIDIFTSGFRRQLEVSAIRDNFEMVDLVGVTSLASDPMVAFARKRCGAKDETTRQIWGADLQESGTVELLVYSGSID